MRVATPFDPHITLKLEARCEWCCKDMSLSRDVVVDMLARKTAKTTIDVVDGNE